VKSNPIFVAGIVLGVIIIAVAAYMHFLMPYYATHLSRVFVVLGIGVLFTLFGAAGLFYRKRNAQ
jgi:membrane protein CcdC involved in cytochrome C biogenesis